MFTLFAFLLLSAPLETSPPNIVMIIGDDQAWTDYGFMGHPHIQTPHLDKLASESLLFKRGYVPTSLCRASLATMITGKFPHQHLITSNDPPIPPGVTAANAMKSDKYLADRSRMVQNFEKTPNLARLLGEAGYRSHQSGKWWEGNACRCGGFTEGMSQGDPTQGGRHGDVGLKIGRQGLKEVTAFIDESHKARKPFFLWYAPMMPHQPHNPPDRLFAKYKEKHRSAFVAKYWAMCEWFDETVGELLTHLDQTGSRENTIIVYLHDNGWIQEPEAAKYALKSKQSPYDGGVRTPIMIRWPGKVKPAASEELASSIDLVPTLLAASGVKPKEEFPGLNLLNPETVSKRDAIFGELFEHNAIDIDKPAANLKYRYIIQGTWKLIVPTSRIQKGVVELYDLANDPKEEINLAKMHPEKVAKLEARLDGWWKP